MLTNRSHTSFTLTNRQKSLHLHCSNVLILFKSSFCRNAWIQQQAVWWCVVTALSRATGCSVSWATITGARGGTGDHWRASLITSPNKAKTSTLMSVRYEHGRGGVYWEHLLICPVIGSAYYEGKAGTENLASRRDSVNTNKNHPSLYWIYSISQKFRHIFFYSEEKCFHCSFFLN